MACSLLDFKLKPMTSDRSASAVVFPKARSCWKALLSLAGLTLAVVALLAPTAGARAEDAPPALGIAALDQLVRQKGLPPIGDEALAAIRGRGAEAAGVIGPVVPAVVLWDESRGRIGGPTGGRLYNEGRGNLQSTTLTLNGSRP